MDGQMDGRTADDDQSQQLPLSTLCSGELKIKQARVMIYVHCTPPWWDLSTHKFS